MRMIGKRNIKGAGEEKIPCVKTRCKEQEEKVEENGCLQWCKARELMQKIRNRKKRGRREGEGRYRRVTQDDK